MGFFIYQLFIALRRRIGRMGSLKSGSFCRKNPTRFFVSSAIKLALFGTAKATSPFMNKRLKSSGPQPSCTLGDVMAALSASCRNTRHASALISELLKSGQVAFLGHHRTLHRSPRRD
jgi:hypothetical protein